MNQHINDKVLGNLSILCVLRWCGVGGGGDNSANQSCVSNIVCVINGCYTQVLLIL